MGEARPFISLTSDFAVQSQSVGVMEATARSISPTAVVLHLMHGLPSYDTVAAARTMEAVEYLPVGSHVCICDPGVGSIRRAIAMETVRGDHLVGPDNGVLLPAARVLGGIRRVHELTNRAYMRHPVSMIFHGRDVFVPAASHLANGVPINEFGAEIPVTHLAASSYEEALQFGDALSCVVIQINKFGSLHLNLKHAHWDEYTASRGGNVTLTFSTMPPVTVHLASTFSEVPVGEALILKDDYGRVEVALNMAAFVDRYSVKVGDPVTITMTEPEPLGHADRSSPRDP